MHFECFSSLFKEIKLSVFTLDINSMTSQLWHALKTRSKKSNMKSIILSIMGVLALGGTSIAQTDSTDINLSMTEITESVEADSALIGFNDMSELILDFEITDTVHFGSVQIELTQGYSEFMVFKEVYTLEDLNNNSLIESWAVEISLGDVLSEERYKVFVVIRDFAGAEVAHITKTYLP